MSNDSDGGEVDEDKDMAENKEMDAIKKKKVNWLVVRS